MTKAFMPLYVGDYMSDTAMLSNEEHGIYMKLIMFQWQSGSAISCAEDAYVITSATLKKTKQKVDKILQLFYQKTDAGFVQKRVEKELIKSAEKSALARKNVSNRYASVPTGVPTSAPTDELLNHNHNHINKTPLTPLGGDGSVQDLKNSDGQKRTKNKNSLFDQFWQAYPNKKGRKAAEKAWLKLGAGPPLAEKIMAGLEAQKRSPAWKKDGGAYVPHPATWLNGERWTDETAVTIGSTASGDDARRARLLAAKVVKVHHTGQVWAGDDLDWLPVDSRAGRMQAMVRHRPSGDVVEARMCFIKPPEPT